MCATKEVVSEVAGRAGRGPVPFSEFRAVEWRGRVYWFRPHERETVRRLFAMWSGGDLVAACKVPRSLRVASDAWGDLIVEGPGCRLSFAERPAYLLPLSAG